MRIEKETYGYSSDVRDFRIVVADGDTVAEELTVTITLKEYRDLLEAKVRADEVWRLRRELDEARAELATRAELDEARADEREGE